MICQGQKIFKGNKGQCGLWVQIIEQGDQIGIFPQNFDWFELRIYFDIKELHL